MQQLNDRIFKIPEIKCFKNCKAEMVCVSKCCDKFPFVCSEKQCQCTRKQHYNCIHTKWSNIVERVSAKRVVVNQELKETFQYIQNIYNTTIEELSDQREKFIEWRQSQGLNPFEREFMTIISENQQKKLTGKFMNSVYFNIQNRENEDNFKNIESVQAEWQFGSKMFEQLKQTIHDIYILNNKNYFQLKYKQESSTIKALLPKKQKAFNLLYSAKFERFSLEKFRANCYDKQNTLVMVRTKDKILCGFTPHKWNGTETGQWVKASGHALKTFTFDFSTKEEYVSPTGYQIFRCNKFGPCFGGGTDIILYQKESKNQRVKFPISYQTRSYYVYSSKFYSSQKEQLLNWQVFQVIWDEKEK